MACSTAVDFRAGLHFLRGLTSSAFPPTGVFALPSKQQLEAAVYMKPRFTIPIKKSERSRF
ncbi:hypothetical protein FO506_29780, partial [Bacillus paranthracis]|nr:hypothetical protein [Bacillus paranthracis]